MLFVYKEDLTKYLKDNTCFGYLKNFIINLKKEKETNLLVPMIKTRCESKRISHRIRKILIVKCETDDKQKRNIFVKMTLLVSVNQNNSGEEYRYCKAVNAWRSFYFLKETSSLKASFKTKLNGYIGYIPVLTSSSQI